MSREYSTEHTASATGLAHAYRLSPDPRAPIVYLVHGRAGTREVMWIFERAVPADATIVAPQAPLADPDDGGFSWWLLKGDAKQRNEGAERLEKFMIAFEQEHGLKPRGRAAVGFSQGAAILSMLAHRSTVGFVAVGFLAGMVIEDEAAPLSVKSFLIAHGTEDAIVPFAKAERSRDYLERRGATVTFVTDPVAHKLGSQGLRALKEWLPAVLGAQPA